MNAVSENSERRQLKISVDPSLKEKWPKTALGCVTAQVEVAPSPTLLLEDLQKPAAAIANLPDPRSVLDSPQIVATRAAYKALGKDPARYRGSAEALIRRIIAGKALPQVNCIVDIINLVSVESRLPIGLYDLAHVQGPIAFRVGRGGETYKGIGKYDLNLEGLPVFCDELGPHGSPTSDSERTMVTEATQNVLAIMISFSGHAGLDRWAQRMMALFRHFASACDCTNFFV